MARKPSKRELKEQQELISKAFSLLGRRRSEAKTEACRRNARLPRKPRTLRPIESWPCTCGGCPDVPRTTCVRGLNIRRRIKAGIEVPGTDGRPVKIPPPPVYGQPE